MKKFNQTLLSALLCSACLNAPAFAAYEGRECRDMRDIRDTRDSTRDSKDSRESRDYIKENREANRDLKDSSRDIYNNRDNRDRDSSRDISSRDNRNYQQEQFSIDKYAEEIPGIGLISDSIKFDGIQIENFRFDNNKKYIFVKPDQDVSAFMHYRIDASELKTLHRHHLIIGLYNYGPQHCILHSYGIKDSEGDATVTLKAPSKKGVYQVRFCHSRGLTDDEALKAWWRGDGPSSKTIVGIIVVQ